MTVTLIGLVFLVLAAVAAVRGSQRTLAFGVGLAGTLPTTAALTSSSFSLSPFYLLALVSVALLLLGKGSSASPVRSRGWRLLVAFAASCAVVTALAPLFFGGLLVIDPDVGIDVGVVAQRPLEYDLNMAVQLGYLLLGLTVAYYLARSSLAEFATDVAMSAIIVVNAACLLWTRVAGSELPDSLFRNFLGSSYDANETRFYGVFSEPSALAVATVTAATYHVVKLQHGQSLMRLMCVAAALPILVYSESGTAALTAVVLLTFLLVTYATGFLFLGRRVSPLALPALGLLIVVVVTSDIPTQVRETISSKSLSASAENRFAADQRSISILQSTNGFGVGLGANRPSSFASMVASSAGVVGFTLLVIATLVLVLPAIRQGAPVAWAMVALITAKVIAEPDLSTPILWLLFGALLVAHPRVPRDPRSTLRVGAQDPRGARPRQPAIPHRASGPNDDSSRGVVAPLRHAPS